MNTARRSESSDELFSEATRLYKAVGSKQLRELGRILGLTPIEVETIYLGRLIGGSMLPPLLISRGLLENEVAAR